MNATIGKNGWLYLGLVLVGSVILIGGNVAFASAESYRLWRWILLTVGPTCYVLVPLGCYAFGGLAYVAVASLDKPMHDRLIQHLHTVGGSAFAVGLMGTDLVLITFNSHPGQALSAKIMVAFASTLVGLVINTVVSQGTDAIDLLKSKALVETHDGTFGEVK